MGIRLNKRPPNIAYTRKEKGGVVYRTQFPQAHLEEDMVKAICAEYKIHNAEFQVREPNVHVEDIIDVIEGKNS